MSSDMFMHFVGTISGLWLLGMFLARRGGY